jgi:hypothetical protein
MRTRKRKIGFFSGIFGLLALVLTVSGIYLALSNRNASPVLVRQPEAARVQVQTMLDALCAGDYQKVSSCLYGTPDLGMDGQAADPVGQLFWEALGSSFRYEVPGDFHATDSGVALDVTISALDVSAVTVNLRERARALLEERIAAAEDPSEIYDANNEYREDFVMDALYDAAREAMDQDAREITWDLTLNLIYENGQWWIMPEQELLKALSGGILS